MSNQGARAELHTIPRERTPARSLAGLRSRFVSDERGAVAMTFGVAFIPCIMMVGFAIDWGRVTVVKQGTQAVLDGAALAAARAYQSTTLANRTTAAEQASKDYWAAVNPNTAVASPTGAAVFKGAMKHAVQGVTTLAAPVYTAGATELTLEVTQWIRTPFLTAGELLDKTNIANVGAPVGCETKYRCTKVTQKSTVKLMQGGGTDGETLEIAVMLDVTGSMLWEPGKSTTLSQTDNRTKLMMMKKAAKSFVDIVLPETSDDGSTRMSLVPFSQDVFLGTTRTSAIAPSQASCTRNVAGCGTFAYQFWSSSDWQWKETSRTRRTNCLGGRYGTNMYTDVSPSTSPLLPIYESCATYAGDDVKNLLIPLQNNPATLKTAIDGLHAEGGTAGHIGTAWAWYTLSPNWSGVWPEASAPKSYTAEKNKKVAVLMTDGDYNHEHCKGVQDSRNIMSAEGSNTICSVPSSKTQAENLCAAMKAADITVYTIAFDVSTSSQTFLREKCAKTAAHAYNANSEASLLAAFQDIALKTARVVVFK